MLKDLKLSGFTAAGILFVCLISFMFIYFMGPLSLPETDLINDSMSRPTLVKSITRSFENPFEGLMPAISQPGVGPQTPAGPPLPASAAELVIWEFLISKGYTPMSAAAILGNIQQESGMNSACIQGSSTTPWEDLDGLRSEYGAGLCQWTSPGRKAGFRNAVIASGKPWTDIGVQLDYLWLELTTGYKSCLPDKLNAITDIAQATEYYEIRYEGAGKPLMDKRIRYATDIYNRHTQ